MRPALRVGDLQAFLLLDSGIRFSRASCMRHLGISVVSGRLWEYTL